MRSGSITRTHWSTSQVERLRFIPPDTFGSLQFQQSPDQEFWNNLSNNTISAKSQKHKQLATATIKNSLKKAKKNWSRNVFLKNIFITKDVILTNEFFPEAITYIIGKTPQKENQVKQNIVPLSKGAFFLQKQHTFSQLAQHSLTQKERNHIILDVCAFLLFCFFHH